MLALASDSSETIGHHKHTWHGNCLRHENASRVNYSDLGLHLTSQILIMKIIIVRLLFPIKNVTDFDHENNNCSIILETIQAVPIKFAVKIV